MCLKWVFWGVAYSEILQEKVKLVGKCLQSWLEAESPCSVGISSFCGGECWTSLEIYHYSKNISTNKHNHYFTYPCFQRKTACSAKCLPRDPQIKSDSDSLSEKNRKHPQRHFIPWCLWEKYDTNTLASFSPSSCENH